jgi:hypothetical protein
VDAGKAPGVIEEIEAGTSEVLVEAPRYMPFVAKLEVRGKRQDETLAVKLTPAWADFKIASQPAGAQVSVDGKLLGPTPLAAELLHGEHRLSVGGLGTEHGRAGDASDLNQESATGLHRIFHAFVSKGRWDTAASQQHSRRVARRDGRRRGRPRTTLV